MIGWLYRLNGHEFKQTPGDGEGQGGLVCCGSWGHKESDTTERLNKKDVSYNGEYSQDFAISKWKITFKII